MAPVMTCVPVQGTPPAARLRKSACAGVTLGHRSKSLPFPVSYCGSTRHAPVQTIPSVCSNNSRSLLCRPLGAHQVPHADTIPAGAVHN